MHILSLLPFALVASAAPRSYAIARAVASNVKCPIIFDGRVSQTLSLASFDSATTSPFNSQNVKGENITFASTLLLPVTAPSRFDEANQKALEVTIDDRSIFRGGDKLQTAFRRTGLLLKDDKNDAGADAADSGIVTFHWSVKQDTARPLNLSHEYMNLFHEKADFSGNQFAFLGGVVLAGDGGNGIDSKEEKEKWRIQNAKQAFVFETPICFSEWQNFAIQLDYTKE
ncbi:hypothetical protein GQ44DRAFT_696847 [Phaeosphaeriaceae sp. PMI808]|nr:hypothetical protein GQ44DRAFT_696847 [Phaeosphaeriaceae sp. PMI808]